MRCGVVTECNEEAKMKEEDMIRSIIPELLVGGEDIMAEKTIPVFPVGGEESMFVSTTSSRHMGMTDTLLEREVTKGECTTMISGLRSRRPTFLILMEDIHMIG